MGGRQSVGCCAGCLTAGVPSGTQTELEGRGRGLVETLSGPFVVRVCERECIIAAVECLYNSVV